MANDGRMESLRLVWMDPDELTDNPRNWRKHPKLQIDALSGVLSEVGWAGACLFNERTNRMIDGHARKKIAKLRGDALVPVLVGSWDEQQEAKILATLDPLGALAEADEQNLKSLLAEVSSDNDAVTELLRTIADQNGLDFTPSGTTREDEVPEPPTEPITKPGDLWLLGAYWECEACHKRYEYQDGLAMKECPCG